MIQGAGE
jgi:hypothetical protein